MRVEHVATEPKFKPIQIILEKEAEVVALSYALQQLDCTHIVGVDLLVYELLGKLSKF